MTFRGCFRSSTLLALVVLGAQAAEPATYGFQDLRLGFASTPLPDVKETIKSSAGSTTVTWGDPTGTGQRVNLLWMHGTSQPNQGFIWGVESAYARYVLGENSALADPVTLRQVGLDLLAGWQYGITGEAGFRGHIELTPFVGTGWGWMNKGERAFGMYREYGLRGGAYLSEKGVLAGVTMAWVANHQSLAVDSGATRNQLVFDAEGLRLGLELGLRF